jgi:CRISPR-associated protein Cas6
MSYEDDEAAPESPDDIVDAMFAIACPCLPVDHAWALSRAVQAELPWFAGEPLAGLHAVYGAASAAGWMRPEGADALLQLSHRAKLALRLPRRRVADAAALVGRTLEVAGWPLRVERASVRPLSRITTLFSRSVLLAAGDDEPAFLAAASEELAALGIRPETMLPGRATAIATPAGSLEARSLMVSGLTPAQSLALQRAGLGVERKIGCGLFIPHKDVGDLRARAP